jgi:hypothetical protein
LPHWFKTLDPEQVRIEMDVMSHTLVQSIHQNLGQRGNGFIRRVQFDNWNTFADLVAFLQNLSFQSFGYLQGILFNLFQPFIV